MSDVPPITDQTGCLNQRTISDFLSGKIDDQHEFDSIAGHLTSCERCTDIAAEQASDNFQQLIVESAPVSNSPRSRITFSYDIIEEIGRGGTGIVYRARQSILERDVALKMLIGGVHATKSQIARLRRESASLAKLDHPNIVRVFESGEQDGTPFIAMEWLDGMTLDRALAKQLPEPRIAAKMLVCLADAIETAHQSGVTHLDLKPQNIILVNNQSQSSAPLQHRRVPVYDNPKILDFGLTSFRTDDFQTVTGELLGTPAYMAPETALGNRKQSGVCTDVYGLGAIFYQCLTGRPPVNGSSTAQTLSAVIENDIVAVKVLRKGVPPDLATICHRCLEKEPESRFPSAAELRDDLRRFLENRPIQSRPASLLQKSFKYCRRHPWIAGVTVLLLFFVISAFLGLVYHQQSLEAESRRTATERDEALANYSKSRKSLWHILDVASTHPNANSPDIQVVISGQCLEALKLFETLANEDPSDQAQLDLADIRIRAGAALMSKGDNERGKELLKKADETLSNITDPDQRNALALLFNSKTKQSIAQLQSGNPQLALELLQASRPLAIRLYKNPNPSIYDLDSMAWHEHATANAMVNLAQRENAVIHYSEAIELRRQALELDPRNIELLTRLAESQISLGVVQMNLSDTENAQLNYQTAINSLNQVLAEHPKDAAVRIAIASADLNRCSICFFAEHNAEEAIEICTQGIEILQPILKSDPNHWEARHYLSMLYGNRARFASDTSDQSLVIPDLEAAVAYAETMEVRESCLFSLLGEYENSGKVESAFKRIKSETEAKNVEDFYRFRMLKRAVSLLKESDEQGDEVSNLKINIQSWSLNELKQLSKNGFFRDNARYQHAVLESKTFEPMREMVPVEDLENLLK